jgi:UDP-N-acetylmuramyl pentapeptide phosphotransferase/UDP-N-acetylglucosamine-1-phosphate transferase
VHALPLIVSFVTAFVLAPAALRALAAGELTHENYRGVRLPYPGGAVIVVAAGLALIPLTLLGHLADVEVFRHEVGLVMFYALGVAFLGLLDDLLGGEARGWRGHGAAILGGGLSTGALKAAGALGFALFALSDRFHNDLRYLLAVAVLVLSTNLFNLLDLRPGRAAKAFVLFGLASTIGAWTLVPLEALGLFVGPVLVIGLYDLRERALLGDTGSNLVGALAGLWIVLSWPPTGQAIALAIIVAMTVYGEFRSISKLIERTPLLRHLDSLGRPRWPVPDPSTRG